MLKTLREEGLMKHPEKYSVEEIETRLQQAGSLIMRGTGDRQDEGNEVAVLAGSMQARLAWAESQLMRITQFAGAQVGDAVAAVTTDGSESGRSTPTSPTTPATPAEGTVEQILETTEKFIPAVAEGAMQLLEKHGEALTAAEMDAAVDMAERWVPRSIATRTSAARMWQALLCFMQWVSFSRPPCLHELFLSAGCAMQSHGSNGLAKDFRCDGQD